MIAYVPAGGVDRLAHPLFPHRRLARARNDGELRHRHPGHPDPRRLFIDPAIDAAVLERLIPYSTLVNAASTKALWDKVLPRKGGAS